MAEPQDLLELLLEDHWVMDQLLDRLDETDDPSELRRLLLDLGELLAGHEVIEHELVFPTLAVDDDHGHRRDEHGEINLLLDEMRSLSALGHGFRKRACAVVIELRTHCRIEEETVFPMLRDVVPVDELVRLGDRARDLRRSAPAFPVVPAL